MPCEKIVITISQCLRNVSNFKGRLLDKQTVFIIIYYRVMCNAMLINVRETVGCLSQQPRGTCRMTWSSFRAVRTFRLFMKQPLYITHIRTRRGHLHLRKLRSQIRLSLQNFSIS